MNAVTKSLFWAGFASAALVACADAGTDGSGGGDTGGSTTSNTGGASNTTTSNTTSAGGGFVTSTGGNGTGGATTNGSGGAATGGGGSGTGGAATGGGGAATNGTGGAATGGGGAGGGSNCTPITLDELFYDGDSLGAGYFGYGGLVSQFGGADDDGILLSLIPTAMTMMWSGVVDLASTENSNNATCSTCLLVGQDADSTGAPAKWFFPSSGTIDFGSVSMSADDLYGKRIGDGALTNVTLVEVTLDMTTGESTPVIGGECLTITSPIAMDGAGWTCVPTYFDDGDCDCGCGVVDIDCPDASAASCDYCQDSGSCDLVACDSAASVIDPANNATCSGAPWTCDPTYYDDGLYCDCGCGQVDPDCTNATVASCDFCDEGCDTVDCDDPASTINATNNAVCVAP